MLGVLLLFPAGDLRLVGETVEDAENERSPSEDLVFTFPSVCVCADSCTLHLAKHSAGGWWSRESGGAYVDAGGSHWGCWGFAERWPGSDSRDRAFKKLVRIV